MPSLSELPGGLSRKNLIKALVRLGFILCTKGGKGSHVKITYKNQKSITIPSENLSKNILYYVLKEIEANTGVTWEDIKKEL